VPWVSKLNVLNLFLHSKELENVKSVLDKIKDSEFVDGSFKKTLEQSNLLGSYKHFLNIQDLILNLIGILIFLFFGFFTIRKGIKSFHSFANISAFLKWGISGLFMLTTVFLAFNNHLFKTLVKYTYIPFSSHDQSFFVFLKNFNNAFMVFFYFFLGFETFSSATRNIHEPAKTIKKAIFWVLGVSTLIYLFETFFMIGALGEFNVLNVANTIAFKGFGMLGIILFFIQSIALKINGVAQFSLYGGSVLEQLSEDGYFSKKLQTKHVKHFNHNKYGSFPFRGAVVYIFTALIFSVFLIVVPFFFGSSVREITELLSFSTFFYLIIYFFTLLSCLTMS
jgi:amino acid transporter